MNIRYLHAQSMNLFESYPGICTRWVEVEVGKEKGEGGERRNSRENGVEEGE